MLGHGPRAEEAHRRPLVVISTVDPAVVVSSPAGSDRNYTLVCEEPRWLFRFKGVVLGASVLG